jgi:starch synthase (maltosyl-transferring)
MQIGELSDQNLAGQNRVIITNVRGEIEEALFAIKRVVGDEVEVFADIFSDGHTRVAANLLYKKEGDTTWQTTEMTHHDNDRWKGEFFVEDVGTYVYTLHAWSDPFSTWQHDFKKKFDAGVHTETDRLVGIALIEEALTFQEKATLRKKVDALRIASGSTLLNITQDTELYDLMRENPVNKRWVTKYRHILRVTVEPKCALFSSWYELFPRSCSKVPNTHASFDDVGLWLDDIAYMGFDVLYLPPIHPIGHAFRKGANNTLTASDTDPGCPWAIGNPDGGHMSIHKALGTIEDFIHLVDTAKEKGIAIALDLAFQCAPDHPYVQEHPEWFLHTPDGKILHAENPPKKYEDIVPFNFETNDWKSLWQELLRVVLFWIDTGIRIFRVDNPHTKPFIFWQWLISEVKKTYPEVLFLSEAFTRPKVMHHLAKLGFSQSYTYFTWRYTKHELSEYVKELVTDEISDYFRPNFWPNTPDILPINLQNGQKASFMARLVLAATLSSNYGVYGPPYEMMHADAVENKEEYLNAEKYEIKYWDRSQKSPIKDLMRIVNVIRKENPALQQTKNITFLQTDNEHIIAYAKYSTDRKNIVVVAVNLDPDHTQSTTLHIPFNTLCVECEASYSLFECISHQKSMCETDACEVTLDPKEIPCRIYKVQVLKRREKEFEYFM